MFFRSLIFCLATLVSDLINVNGLASGVSQGATLLGVLKKKVMMRNLMVMVEMPMDPMGM